MDWHDVESYFRPNGIGKYSFVGDNEIVFNKLDKLFDAVILSDCSQCPVHPQLKSVFHGVNGLNFETEHHRDIFRREQPNFLLLRIHGATIS